MASSVQLNTVELSSRKIDVVSRVYLWHNCHNKWPIFHLLFGNSRIVRGWAVAKWIPHIVILNLSEIGGEQLMDTLKHQEINRREVKATCVELPSSLRHLPPSWHSGHPCWQRPSIMEGRTNRLAFAIDFYPSPSGRSGLGMGYRSSYVLWCVPGRLLPIIDPATSEIDQFAASESNNCG